MKSGTRERFGGVGICERGREKNGRMCVVWLRKKASGQYFFAMASSMCNLPDIVIAGMLQDGEGHTCRLFFMFLRIVVSKS